MGTNEATLIYGYYFVLQNSCKVFNSNFFLPTPSLTEFENFPAKSLSILPITLLEPSIYAIVLFASVSTPVVYLLTPSDNVAIPAFNVFVDQLLPWLRQFSP